MKKMWVGVQDVGQRRFEAAEKQNGSNVCRFSSFGRAAERQSEKSNEKGFKVWNFGRYTLTPQSTWRDRS